MKKVLCFMIIQMILSFNSYSDNVQVLSYKDKILATIEIMINELKYNKKLDDIFVLDLIDYKTNDMIRSIDKDTYKLLKEYYETKNIDVNNTKQYKNKIIENLKVAVDIIEKSQGIKNLAKIKRLDKKVEYLLEATESNEIIENNTVILASK